MKERARRPWLRKRLLAHRGSIASALSLGLVASGCAALLMFTSGYLISATALAATTLFSVMVPIACVQLFGFGRPLARYAERLASHGWVLKVTSDLRVALFRAIGKLTRDPASRKAAGEYLGLLSDDVAHLQNLYLRVVFPTAIAYLLAIGASVVLGVFSAGLGLLMALSLAAVAVVLPYSALLATRAKARRAKELKAEFYLSAADGMAGSIDWMLSGRAPEARGELSRADAAMRAAGSRIRLEQRAFSLAASLSCGVLAFALVIWAGSSLEAPGPKASWIAALVLGFLPLIEGFSVLPAAFAESTVHEDAIGRLDALMAPTACPIPPGEPEKDRQQPNCGPSVELRGVSYTYPRAARPALSDIDLIIEQGSSTAILGRSGAGKSTLAELVSGALSPDSGTVLVDGGAPGPHAVGYLGQVPYLFNRTLRENLLMGARRTDEELVALLESVGLANAYAALPRGLDTIIGETGVGFSGGEAHRVALARVLAADTPIILVDEPFSALDPDAERSLLDTLLKACAERTLVVITHHLSEIQRFDRVIFIEDGRIGLDGSPAELIQTSPRFRQLAAADRSLAPKRAARVAG